MQFEDKRTQRERELADKIKAGLTATGATISETKPRSAYVENLPEGITEESVAALAKYHSRYISAAHLAVGEVAADILLSDRTIKTVTGSVGYFNAGDSLDFVIDATKTFRNQFASTPDEATVVKHLVIRNSVTVASDSGYGVKSLTSAMQTEFAGLFAK